MCIRYVHHGVQYANVLPVYHMPEIPVVIPTSSVLMVSQSFHFDWSVVKIVCIFIFYKDWCMVL